jgi:hypothetical protein
MTDRQPPALRRRHAAAILSARPRRTAVAVAGVVVAAAVLLALWAAATTDARLLPPPGLWPAPVVGATNPLEGTPSAANGAPASADVALGVWLPSGHRHREEITRTMGDSAIVRGRLRDRATRRSIRAAVVQLAAQNVSGGDWYLAGVTSTNRKGGFKAVLPPGPTRRVAILYWPFMNSPAPVYSRRLLVRSAGRVYLKTIVRGRSVLFTGRVSGDAIPPGGLLVAAQVRNGGAWVSVRLVRTQPSGRFRARYRFKYGNRRFLVRATAPSQPGWPLYSGSSRPQLILTR